MRDLIGGKVVRLSFPGKRKRDSFGRLLCRVEVDGVDVGAAMLDAGHAVVYRR